MNTKKITIIFSLVITIFIHFIDNAKAAETAIKFYFNNEEITKVLDFYSRASGQKMIIDSSVRGKVYILNPEAVELSEAFNQISKALAMNSFAIVRESDTLVVRPVKQIQRSLIEVGAELPIPKPERMFSWVVTLQHVPVSVVSKELRNLSSKDGEMTILNENNQIIFVDWVSNLYRIRELIKQIDLPKNPNLEKTLKEYKDSNKKK